MRPYPLVMEPIYKAKVWGGRALERLGRSLPEGEMIGESWEVADLGETSVDGGGGGEARSLIANGEMRGLTLGEAVRAMGINLVGDLRLGEGGAFPLLAKYLDARENLSVQVHPSPAYAAKHPEARLKTETWYVVHAEPGAAIYRGFRAGVAHRDVERAVRTGSGEGLEGLLRRVPVRAGDVHHLPSGTCHALGAGVVVAEVQTPSDTTYRLWDWGRTGRTLHLDQALECIDLDERGDAVRGPGHGRATVVKTSHYEMVEWFATDGTEAPVHATGERPMVWMVLEGEGRIRVEGARESGAVLKRGTTVVVPAMLTGATVEWDRDAHVVEVCFPG